MSNGKVMLIHLVVGLIKRRIINEWIFWKIEIFIRQCENWIKLSNYSTKADLKNATGVDTTDFAKKAYLDNLKSDVNKLNISELKNVPTNLRNLKSKVVKLDVDKLVPVTVDLSKLIDVVKNDVVRKDVYNAKIKIIDDKIPDIPNLTTNTTLNGKINEVKNEIPHITNLVKTSALNAKKNYVKNEIRNITNLATTAVLTAAKNKIPDHSKYITTPEFDRLTAENFAVRLAQAKLAIKNGIAYFVKKADFNDKLNTYFK